MKIGIFGGTFDPPHLGHIGACQAFLDSVELDCLYVMPAYIPPHKAVLSGTDANSRLDMARIAFGNLSEKIIVSDLEYKRDKKSYTAHTLQYFKDAYNDIDIYFLCGTDMILTMDSWYCPEYIFKNAKIVYVRRENDPEITKQIDLKCKQYVKKFNAEVLPLKLEVLEISSSEIRAAIEQNEDLTQFLSKEIIDYIKDNKLYLEN